MAYYIIYAVAHKTFLDSPCCVVLCCALPTWTLRGQKYFCHQSVAFSGFMVLPSEVLQQFGPTAAYSFKATPPSTAGSSSVTMQLDSEDEEDFLANLWFIIFTLRMQGVDFLELAETHSWWWQCALQCVREQWQYLEETIEQLASQAAQQPGESWRVMPSAYIIILVKLLVQ